MHMFTVNDACKLHERCVYANYTTEGYFERYAYRVCNSKLHPITGGTRLMSMGAIYCRWRRGKLEDDGVYVLVARNLSLHARTFKTVDAAGWVA